eukprot:scaffold240_cov243-Pinguiococcus_pyrenoidosus.AAC.1
MKFLYWASPAQYLYSLLCINEFDGYALECVWPRTARRADKTLTPSFFAAWSTTTANRLSWATLPAMTSAT